MNVIKCKTFCADSMVEVVLTFKKPWHKSRNDKSLLNEAGIKQ